MLTNCACGMEKRLAPPNPCYWEQALCTPSKLHLFRQNCREPSGDESRRLAAMSTAPKTTCTPRTRHNAEGCHHQAIASQRHSHFNSQRNKVNDGIADGEESSPLMMKVGEGGRAARRVKVGKK